MKLFYLERESNDSVSSIHPIQNIGISHDKAAVKQML